MDLLRGHISPASGIVGAEKQIPFSNLPRYLHNAPIKLKHLLENRSTDPLAKQSLHELAQLNDRLGEVLLATDYTFEGIRISGADLLEKVLGADGCTGGAECSEQHSASGGGGGRTTQPHFPVQASSPAVEEYPFAK